MLSPQAGLTSETVPATLSSSPSSSSSESPAAETTSAVLNKESNVNSSNDVQEQQQDQPPSATFRYTTYSNRLAQLKELEERQLRLQEMCEAALQENELTNNNNNNDDNSVVKASTTFTAPMLQNESPQPYESPSSFLTPQTNVTRQTGPFSKPLTNIPAPGKDETTLHEDLLTGEVQSFRDAASYTRLSSINSNNSEYNRGGEDGINNNRKQSLPSLSSSELPSPNYGQQGNIYTSLQTKINPKINTTNDGNSNKRKHSIPAPAPELFRTNPVLSKPYHHSTRQPPPPPPPPMPEHYPTTSMKNNDLHHTLSDLENKFSILRSSWRNKARPSTKYTRQAQEPLHFATHSNKALVSPQSEATSANRTLHKDNYYNKSEPIQSPLSSNIVNSYSVNDTNSNNTAQDSTIENTINKWVTPLHAARLANARSTSPFNKLESSSGIVYTPFPTSDSRQNNASGGGGDDNYRVKPQNKDELEKDGSTRYYRVAPLSPASTELGKHITPRGNSGSQYNNTNERNDNENGKYQTNVKTRASAFWSAPTPSRSSQLPPPPPLESESMSLESSLASLFSKAHKRLPLPNRSSLREKYMPHKQSRRNSMHERRVKHILVSPSTSDAARVHVTHMTSPPIDVVSPFRPSVRSVPVAHRQGKEMFENLPPSRQSRKNAKFMSPPPPPMENEDENVEMYDNHINKRNICRSDSHLSGDSNSNGDRNENNDRNSAIDAVCKLRKQLNKSVLRARYSTHLHKDETMATAPTPSKESAFMREKEHELRPQGEGRNRHGRKTSRLSDVWATDEPSKRHSATPLAHDEEQEETSSLSSPQEEMEYQQRNNNVAKSRKQNHKSKHKNDEEHSKHDHRHGEKKLKSGQNREVKVRERHSKRTGNTKNAARRNRNSQNNIQPFNNIDDFLSDSSHTSETTTASSHTSSSSHERTDSIATTSSEMSSSSSSLSSSSSEERNQDKLRRHNKSHTDHRSKGKTHKEKDKVQQKANRNNKNESRRYQSDHNLETNIRWNNSDIRSSNNSANNTSRYFSDTETAKAKAKAKAEALARHLAKSITEKKKLNENVHDLQQDLDDCNDEIARLHRIINRHSAKMESRSALLKELEAKEEEVQLYELKLKRLQRMLAQSEQHPWEKQEESEKEEQEREYGKQVEKMSSHHKRSSKNNDNNTKVDDMKKTKSVNTTPTKATSLETQNKQRNYPPSTNINNINSAEDRRKMEEEKCQLAEELTMAMEQICVLDRKLTEMERNAAASRLREVQSQYKHQNNNSNKQANQHREQKDTKSKLKLKGRSAMSINVEDRVEEKEGHISTDREPLTLSTSLSPSTTSTSSITPSLPQAPEQIMLRSTPSQSDKLIESLIKSNEQAIHENVVQESQFNNELRRYEKIVNALHHSLRDCLSSLEEQDDEVHVLQSINTHLRSKSREQVEQLGNIKTEASNVSRSITTSRNEALKMLSLANNLQDANNNYSNHNNSINNNNSSNITCYDGATTKLAPMTVQFVEKAMHDFTLLAKFLRDLREISVDNDDSDDNNCYEDNKTTVDNNKRKIGRDQRNKLRVELFKEVDQCVKESEHALQQLQEMKAKNKNRKINKNENNTIVEDGGDNGNSVSMVCNNVDNNNVHRALFHENNDMKSNIEHDKRTGSPEEEILFKEQLSIPDHFDAVVDEPQRVDSARHHNNNTQKTIASTHKRGEVGQVSVEELSLEELEIDSTIPSPLPPPPPLLSQKTNWSREHFPLHIKEDTQLPHVDKTGVNLKNKEDDVDPINDRLSKTQCQSSPSKEKHHLAETDKEHDLKKEKLVDKAQKGIISHELKELQKHTPHKESTEKQREEHDVHKHNHLHLLSPASQTGNAINVTETGDVNYKEEGNTNHESSISPSPVRPEMEAHHLSSLQAMHYYPTQHNNYTPTALPVNRPCESLMREDISSDVSKENEQHDKIHTIPLSPILSPPPPLPSLQRDEEELKEQPFVHDETKHVQHEHSSSEKEFLEQHEKELQQQKPFHVNQILEKEVSHKLPENVNVTLIRVNEDNDNKNDVTIPFIDAPREPTMSNSSSNSERHGKSSHMREVSAITHNSDNNDDNIYSTNNNYCDVGPDNNTAVDNVSVSSPTITENNSYSSSSGQNQFSKLRLFHQEHKEHHNDDTMSIKVEDAEHKQLITDDAEVKEHTPVKLTGRLALEAVSSQTREEEKPRAQQHKTKAEHVDNDKKKNKIVNASSLSSLASSSFVSTTAEESHSEEEEEEKYEKHGIDTLDNLLQHDHDDDNNKENHDNCPSKSDSSSFTWRTTTTTAATTHPNSEPSASVAHSTLTPSHTFLHTPAVNSMDDVQYLNKENNEEDVKPHARHEDKHSHGDEVKKETDSLINEQKEKEIKRIKKRINDTNMSDNKDENWTTLHVPSELITVPECDESTHTDPVSITVSRTTPSITMAPQEHVNKHNDNEEHNELDKPAKELMHSKIENIYTAEVKAKVKGDNKRYENYENRNVQDDIIKKDKVVVTSARDSKDSVQSSARSHLSLLPHSADRCESTPMPSSIAPQPEPPISPISSSYSTSRPREQNIVSREHSVETKGQPSKMALQELELEYENENNDTKEKNEHGENNMEEKHETISPKGKMHTKHTCNAETLTSKKQAAATALDNAPSLFVNTPHNIHERNELGKATSERTSARQKSPSTRAQSFTRTNSNTSLSSNHVTYRENKAAMMRRELNEPKHKTAVPQINAGIHKARSLLAHSITTPRAQLMKSTLSSPIVNVDNAQQKQCDNNGKNSKAESIQEQDKLQYNKTTTTTKAATKALSNSESLQQEKLSKLPSSTNLNNDEHITEVNAVKENANPSHSPEITPIKQIKAKPNNLTISPKTEPHTSEETYKMQYASESYNSSPEPCVLNVEMHTPRLHSTSSRHSYMESPLITVKVSPITATTKSLMHPYTIVSTSPNHASENNNGNDYKCKWSKASSVPSSQFSRKSSMRSSEIPEYVYARMPANRPVRSITRSHSSYSQEQSPSPDAVHRIKEQKITNGEDNKYDNDNDNVDQTKHGKVDNQILPQECRTSGNLRKNEKKEEEKEQLEKSQREKSATTPRSVSSKPLNIAMKTSARFATSSSSSSSSSSESSSPLASLRRKSCSPRRPLIQKTSTLHNESSLHEPLTKQKEEISPHHSKEDHTAASFRSHAKSTSLSAREPPSPKRSTAEFTGFINDEVTVEHEERESATPPAQQVRIGSVKQESIRSNSGSSGSGHQTSMPMERISVHSMENSPLNTCNTITISPLTTSPSISPMRKSMSMQRSPTQIKATTPTRRSPSTHNGNIKTTPSPSSVRGKPKCTVYSTPVSSIASVQKSNTVIDVPDSTLTSLRQPLSPQSPATSARKAEVEKILQRLRAKRVDSARRRQQYEKK